jgi:uncharacterized protein (TIGR02611 family)
VIRQILVALLGGIVLVAGIVLIPLPGPGLLLILLGLSILASEFFWARQARAWVQRKLRSVRRRVEQRRRVRQLQ